MNPSRRRLVLKNHILTLGIGEDDGVKVLVKSMNLFLFQALYSPT